ncbi:hypothetical protein FAZ69_31710 [Trinickia terrae]|uniref:Uncharacterized protein n=1 Tax=Trinickia terrae TaxID=2571161 RepID=A0A4U1HD43_9BURK|nr:hypothetical protein [Trinickia terrae]TKC78819.1 hypothetical protein FAZ69_31710 [Trinickia terrae]
MTIEWGTNFSGEAETVFFDIRSRHHMMQNARQEDTCRALFFARSAGRHLVDDNGYFPAGALATLL